jgi:hypothetical protein
MPIFVYFAAFNMTDSLGNLEGLCGAPVSRADIQNLVVFYSEVAALPTESSALAQEALRFFRVQEAAFSCNSIVPFRFPARFTDRVDLELFINEQARALQASLEKVSGKSQFEIRISASQRTSADVSGTEYLRARASQSHNLNKLETMCRDQLVGIALEWHTAQEAGRTVLYVLVPREAEQEVVERFRSMPGPAEGSIVVLGPWPPGAFVQLAAAVGQ